MTGKNWLNVPLSEVIKHRKNFIQIDDLTTYKRCRVQLHAQGIVLRDSVLGSEIKTKKQQICHTGEFLVAEIDAKVGGFGIVPDSLEGAIVSSHYFLFTLDERFLDRRFLDYFSRTRYFRDQVTAQGSTNYAAIRPEDVLGYEISLPPIDDQRRIVARIEELAARIEEARELRRRAVEETEAIKEAICSKFINNQGPNVVGDYAKIQSGYAFKSEWFSDTGIRLVRNVNIGHGHINWNNTARIPELRRKEFGRFELSPGDILISLDRPIISTGLKVACVAAEDIPSLLLQRVGRVCFHSEDILPDFLFAWLQSPGFINAIDPGRSNGVPHISPKDIEGISFTPPSILDQHRIVSYLKSLRSKIDVLQRHQAETAAELDALLPAVLERAFRASCNISSMISG